MNLSNPRVLCISALFPPIGDSEAICGGKMIKALLDYGVDISVLYRSKAMSLRTYARDGSSFWKPLEEIATDISTPTYHERFKGRFGATVNRMQLYLGWIDAVVGWARRAHAERSFDLVYSRSLPTVSHLAGYWCAKKLNLPWVVNMNDPWDKFLVPGASQEGSSLYAKVSTYWFKKTLRNADVVTCPNERLHRYHAGFAQIDRPAVILPHIGYTAPPFSNRSAHVQTAPFRLVHAGKLGIHEVPSRPTDALLIGFGDFLRTHPEARSEAKLVLVGPEDTATTAVIAALGLQANVESVGSVSYEDSLRHIAGAAVCVLVEAKLEEGIFLPSKLVDYIAARKPVLALSPKVGVTADMAGQAGGGITHVSRHDAEAVQEAIAGLYADYRRGTLHLRAPSEGFAGQFKPDAVAGKFLAAIDRVGWEGRPERNSWRKDRPESCDALLG
jgi:glycosyltransferase involved in cell wall biosynthesis